MAAAVDTAAAMTVAVAVAVAVVESAGKPANVVFQNYTTKPTKGAVQRPHPLCLMHIRVYLGSEF